MGTIIIQIVTIYLAGITGLYKGVPVGFAIQASPYLTAACTAIGSLTAVFVIYFSGTSLKKWIINNFGKKKIEKRKSRFTSIMERYGVVGLGLIATGIIGPIITIILGLMLVQETKRLMIFLSIGIVLWSVALTIIASISLDLVKQLI
ncbi:MAG: hypothetical protein ACQESJ_05520 [Bacteroidota bacterium]